MHPLQGPCVQVLQFAADLPHLFLTNAEVLQELLHRYLAIRAWERGRGVFRDFAELMQGRIESIRASDVEVAASLVDRHAGLSGRDLLHLAVMNRLGVTQIVTADAGFDLIPGIERLDPARFGEWRDSVLSDGA
jgi:predicted nucleic acid-binding protein